MSDGLTQSQRDSAAARAELRLDEQYAASIARRYPNGTDGLVAKYACPCRCSNLLTAREYLELRGRTPEQDRRRPMFFDTKDEGGCYCWMGPGECQLHGDGG